MHDVNGKPVSVGDEVNIPCKVISINQVDNYFIMELEAKYHEKPYHKMIIFEAANDQVVKND